MIMRLSIIGAGLVGAGVARLAVAAGHQVTIANSRGPESLAALCKDIGCEAGTVREAAMAGELVLVAIPLSQLAALPADALADKIVLEANNYYPERDGAFADLDQHETTTSELLARHLPDARIVKAFNAILASDLGRHARPAGSPDRRALPIAGDDPAAKARVAALHDQLGYDTVDAGPLGEGWRFERAKPAYCLPLGIMALRDALASASRAGELPDGSWRTPRDIQISRRVAA